jgi:HD-GYP domain-containing protein (c-di-GMP phosphodiesterase class II)
VFDALSCDRVYRKAIPHEEVLEIIRKDRGTHFDPNLVDLFLSHLPEFLVIRDTHAPRRIYRPSKQELELEPALV